MYRCYHFPQVPILKFTYMKEILKIVIKSKELFQNRAFDKTLYRKETDSTDFGFLCTLFMKC